MNEKEAQDILLERVKKGKDLMNVMEPENFKISTFFCQFALIVEEAYKIKNSLKETLEDGSKSSDGEAILCGFPGTQGNAMDVVSEQLTEMNTAFHNMSLTLKAKSMELQKVPKDKDKAQKALEDAIQPINDIKMLKVVVANSTSSMDKKYAKAVSKLNDLTASLVKKSDPSDRQKKPINELFQTIMEAREKTDTQRKLLINKGNAAIEQFKSLLSVFATFSQARNDNFRELFDVAMYAYMKIAAVLQNASGLIDDAVKKIDPIADLKSYSQARGIVRYDLKLKPFEDSHFDTPVFRELDTKIMANIKPWFDPIGFVKVIHSFRAENEGEMNCVRGKRLLLLERMTGDWTFVMHPITHVVGFVPTQCIKPIGKALGVILRKQKSEIPGSVMIRPGEYVAINSTKPLEFETMRGEVCTNAPANLIGIVHEQY